MSSWGVENDEYFPLAEFMKEVGNAFSQATGCHICRLIEKTGFSYVFSSLPPDCSSVLSLLSQ